MISYTSFIFFIGYFGITYLIYSILPPKLKWTMLWFGSAMFYVVSSRGHVVPIISETLIIYAAGLALQKLNDTMKKKSQGCPI